MFYFFILYILYKYFINIYITKIWKYFYCNKYELYIWKMFLYLVFIIKILSLIDKSLSISIFIKSMLTFIIRIFFNFFLLCFSLLTTTSESPKQKSISWNKSRERICRFYFCTCNSTSCCYEFHWLKMKDKIWFVKFYNKLLRLLHLNLKLNPAKNEAKNKLYLKNKNNWINIYLYKLHILNSKTFLFYLCVCAHACIYK